MRRETTTQGGCYFLATDETQIKHRFSGVKPKIPNRRLAVAMCDPKHNDVPGCLIQWSSTEVSAQISDAVPTLAAF